jgi:uncharacterized protein YciI
MNQENRKPGKQASHLQSPTRAVRVRVLNPMDEVRVLYSCYHNRNSRRDGSTVDSAGISARKAEAIYLRPAPRAAAVCGYELDGARQGALQRHFVRFQEAIKTEQLILAGRTSEPGDKTFGIAIFLAKDEAAARKFMEEDPAVAGGLMTAELHPFSVALEHRNP